LPVPKHEVVKEEEKEESDEDKDVKEESGSDLDVEMEPEKSEEEVDTLMKTEKMDPENMEISMKQFAEDMAKINKEAKPSNTITYDGIENPEKRQ